MKPSFAHEFENQKLTKSQTSETLKVRGQASRLSLLSLRVQILIYSPVCHGGRRRGRESRLLSIRQMVGRLIPFVPFVFDGDIGVVNEPEEYRGFRCEVKVRTAKQARVTVAFLRGTVDECRSFEVVEASVERTHRLQCASGE